jgi:hypothetical protein
MTTGTLGDPHDREPVDQATIDCWRANYGLDKRTPADAAKWWSDNMRGLAPAGCVAALGVALDELEALRALAAPSVPSGEPAASQARVQALETLLRAWLECGYSVARDAETAALLADATPQPAPAGWRPIATAPLNQTVLLAIEGKHITMGEKYAEFISLEPTDDEPEDAKATHWMPLPAAPAAPGGDACPT